MRLPGYEPSNGPTPQGGGEPAGVADGPPIVLPSGVRIQRMALDGFTVPHAIAAEAARAVQVLPQSHQKLLVALGIPIELVPLAQLERLPGYEDAIVGATRVSGEVPNARPERLRVAAFQEQYHGTLVWECVQHEVGHVVNVAARQDLSEAAAEAYAERHP